MSAEEKNEVPLPFLTICYYGQVPLPFLTILLYGKLHHIIKTKKIKEQKNFQPISTSVVNYKISY